MMLSRLRIVGVVVAIIGLIGVIGGAYGWTRIQEGASALAGFSAAQNVTLSYNDQGQLVDRGTTEGADAIKQLLGETWKWPINNGDLNPKDPVVNTGTEYMFQMATVAYHTLHGQQQVTLAAPVAYDGNGDGTIAADAPSYTPETLPQGADYVAMIQSGSDANFAAGTYTVPVEGRYWTGFNRTHPLDGPARESAWSGTVHGLFAELGVGATTAAALQMGEALSFIAIAFGILFIITGLGLLWVGMAKKVEGPAWSREPAATNG
jgi:hypothetical protein